MNIQEKNISGLKVLFVPMNDVYSTTVQLFVKAGSIYETSENNGISHFLEHMFFKGGKRYSTPKQVAQAVESFGGEFNAYTGDEIASYYVKCPPKNASQALDVLADMMTNAQFPQAEMEREKLVVIQEIKMYEDRPQSQVLRKWNRWFSGDNPYGRSILGPEENVKNFTREDLLGHQKSLYTKDNLILVIAGKIEDRDNLEKQIKKYFSHLPEKRIKDKQEYERTLPDSQESFFEKESSQSHLVISAPTFSAHDDRKYAAKILATILGGNMSSRLFQNIREKLGLCYYIGAKHSTASYDGLFLIRAGIDKKRFQFGLDHIYAEIESLVKDGVTQEELHNAKSYMLGKLQMGIESSDQMSEFVGSDSLIYGETKSLQDIMLEYEKVSLQDVLDLLPFLKKENLYLYYIK